MHTMRVGMQETFRFIIKEEPYVGDTLLDTLTVGPSGNVSYYST